MRQPCQQPTTAGKVALAQWNTSLYPDPTGQWPSQPEHEVWDYRLGIYQISLSTRIS